LINFVKTVAKIIFIVINVMYTVQSYSKSIHSLDLMNIVKFMLSYNMI